MQRPDVLDSRTVLMAYAAAAIPVGLAVLGYSWPMPATLTPDRVSMTSLWSLLLVAGGNAVWLSAGVAWQLAQIEDPARRLRALRLLALTIALTGALYWAPAFPVIRTLLPPGAGWLPLGAGATLLMLSFQPELLEHRHASPPGTIVFRDRPSVSLRTRYEEQIRQAGRQEERARLARDLHDAIKQQLFAIQTATATAEARFTSDPAGARQALTAVRTSTREALTEMDVMLEQLQATPLTTPGLIESLKRASEATRFRTGAEVTVEAGDLPADIQLPPGAHQAMLRFAQEALANVARHSRARNVRVHLGMDQEWTPAGSDRRRLLLSVSDDGQGFDASAETRGMGLRNMAARAIEAGGALELTSTPGKGTTVSLSIVNDVASPRRYILYALGGTAAAIYFGISAAIRDDWVSSGVWMLCGMLAAVRFGVAAYRVRLWR